MQWLPKGTHDWDKFITPDELSSMIDSAKLQLKDKTGFVFNPLSLLSSMNVNVIRKV